MLAKEGSGSNTRIWTGYLKHVVLGAVGRQILWTQRWGAEWDGKAGETFRLLYCRGAPGLRPLLHTVSLRERRRARRIPGVGVSASQID